MPDISNYCLGTYYSNATINSMHLKTSGFYEIWLGFVGLWIINYPLNPMIDTVLLQKYVFILMKQEY